MRRQNYNNEAKYISINKKLHETIEKVLESNMDRVVEDYGYTRNEFDHSINEHQSEELQVAINSLCSPEM